MQQQNRVITTAALALGLCVFAAPAWASSFQVTNSSGDTIKVNCTTGGPGTGGDSVELSNGTSTSVFTCSGQIETVLKMKNATAYSFSHSCNSDRTHKTTVSAGSSTGTLSLAHTCSS